MQWYHAMFDCWFVRKKQRASISTLTYGLSFKVEGGRTKVAEKAKANTWCEGQPINADKAVVLVCCNYLRLIAIRTKNVTAIFDNGLSACKGLWGTRVKNESICWLTLDGVIHGHRLFGTCVGSIDKVAGQPCLVFWRKAVIVRWQADICSTWWWLSKVVGFC